MFISFSGYLLLIFIILFIGLRPIDGRFFGDTANYNARYLQLQLGSEMKIPADVGWFYFMKISSKLFSIHTFFTICSFIYVYPLYKLSKQLFNSYWFYSFVMFLVSFSFWNYGVNGVRNGAACSLFLWGLCYREKKFVVAFFFLLAISFHKTLMLPIIAYVITHFYNNPKIYFRGWLLSIPLSLVAGGAFILLFTSLGFADERAAAYLTNQDLEGTSAKTGFRWDFLFHSAFAVFAGWYFVFKRRFRDDFYFQLLNTYLICNAFWVLVIQANYSNRFAYLSWFMMAIVIIYPFLKGDFFKSQPLKMSNVVAAYFAFTYLMFFVYY
ncbi:EpsG family protein [Lentiprolixibacter aurantiacus]|uniref:EpsG family protein n=1 Tax=Lentiprolixibacter aurantiacus TaxID=2993939 RepID=A0AAE3ML69_9FLAO|nr:EpsG family protein [Lentiprolixibacter aurantiacus]MCX2719860.1 EpsG family protein [Lentiprolixibacter aurantiacus]